MQVHIYSALKIWSSLEFLIMLRIFNQKSNRAQEKVEWINFCFALKILSFDEIFQTSKILRIIKNSNLDKNLWVLDVDLQCLFKKRKKIHKNEDLGCAVNVT